MDFNMFGAPSNATKFGDYGLFCGHLKVRARVAIINATRNQSKLLNFALLARCTDHCSFQFKEPRNT
eukprot:5982110-Amphidinium_carterae.1